MKNYLLVLLLFAFGVFYCHCSAKGNVYIKGQPCIPGPPGPKGQKGFPGNKGASGLIGLPGRKGQIHLIDCPIAFDSQSRVTRAAYSAYNLACSGQKGAPGEPGDKGQRGEPGRFGFPGPLGEQACKEGRPSILMKKRSVVSDPGPVGVPSNEWDAFNELNSAFPLYGPPGLPGERGPPGENGDPGFNGLPGLPGISG